MNISGHFFANYMNIFHKTEVQAVILIGLTGLILNWFNCTASIVAWGHGRIRLTFLKKATDKWLFYDHIWPFFANCMVIFHKAEVQTVILRCLRSLNVNQ